ncbi:AraC family transcriptional regulator [Paenibacillus sp. PAMC21692]|uniref:AraC family transcriptional regulator n=1 Tax=Paenibacillus sp. PAMC21692 TaxID=2762320 RepID=UPI00164ECA4F|nr:AraC family transcriptional regulator [Paenibacillus sp. PAMC21692]QNK56752.1 AraC family transcriptional regulator [Paenibacillus sp. PAMC21692]
MLKTARNGGVPLERLRVRLIDVELFAGAEGERMERQLTLLPALIVPIRGEGELELDAGSLRLVRDRAYPVRPDSTFGLLSDRGGELAAAILHFEATIESGKEQLPLAALPAAHLIEMLFEGKDELNVPVKGRLAHLCRSIYENWRSEDGLKRWRAELDMNELIYSLLSAERVGSKASTESALERSKAFMEERFHEDLSIERLASIAKLSPKYYVDAFKKTYGVSAIDTLTNIRMNRAKKLMLHSGLRMKEVAHQVGFADEFYFSRRFKKFAGMSPTAYMKSRSKRIVVYGSSSIIGYMLALGIIPYAAPLHPKWTKLYIERYGADIPVHLDAFRQNHRRMANIEQLVGTKPELIVCANETEDWERQRLAKIAPVFLLPSEETGWESVLLALAARLDAEAEARQWILDYERKAEERCFLVRTGTLGPGRNVLQIRLVKDRLYLDCSSTFHDVMVKGLGFTSLHPYMPSDHGRPITLEELGRLDADWAFMLIRKESETLERWRTLRESSDWQALPVVRDNRLRLLPSDPWREYSPIAIERCLEMAFTMIVE